MKKRLDEILVNRGLVTTRSRAKSVIMAGKVFVDGKKVDKAGVLVREDSLVELREGGIPYVSRGGLKLEGALEDFSLDVKGYVCLDVGSSTGGFTDCLLKRGARKVYAVDVGKGILDFSLRNDERVIVLEGVNFRHAEEDFLPEKVDLVTADVSFISLTLILPPAVSLVKKGGHLLVLVKPQFELSPKDVGKGGVIRSEEKQKEAVEKVVACGERLGFSVMSVRKCCLKGPRGNQEYFVLFQRESSPGAPSASDS